MPAGSETGAPGAVSRYAPGRSGLEIQPRMDTNGHESSLPDLRSLDTLAMIVLRDSKDSQRHHILLCVPCVLLWQKFPCSARKPATGGRDAAVTCRQGC